MARRSLVLALMDGLDSLRPPGFDLMLFVIATLGAVLAAIQPLSEPYAAARIILDPTLFTVALFLALRGSAGLAGIVRTGIIEVYLSYPVSRRGVALALLASRILVPAASLLAVPLLVAGVLLYPVVSRDPASYLIVYTGYLVQALFYGSVFAAIALASKGTGTASILSITFYFAYNVAWLILQAVSGGMGLLYEVAEAMHFNYIAYRYALIRAGSEWLEITSLQALLVPVATLTVMAALVLYFERRFEPA